MVLVAGRFFPCFGFFGWAALIGAGHAAPTLCFVSCLLSVKCIDNVLLGGCIQPQVGS